MPFLIACRWFSNLPLLLREFVDDLPERQETTPASALSEPICIRTSTHLQNSPLVDMLPFSPSLHIRNSLLGPSEVNQVQPTQSDVLVAIAISWSGLDDDCEHTMRSRRAFVLSLISWFLRFELYSRRATTACERQGISSSPSRSLLLYDPHCLC